MNHFKLAEDRNHFWLASFMVKALKRKKPILTWDRNGWCLTKLSSYNIIARQEYNCCLPDVTLMSDQDRDSNIEGVTSQTMLEYLPCPDKTRSKLLELMNSHKGHIFTDLSVHMLMVNCWRNNLEITFGLWWQVCLILFDSQDDDSSIRWDSSNMYEIPKIFLE